MKRKIIVAAMIITAICFTQIACSTKQKEPINTQDVSSAVTATEPRADSEAGRGISYEEISFGDTKLSFSENSVLRAAGIKEGYQIKTIDTETVVGKIEVKGTSITYSESADFPFSWNDQQITMVSGEKTDDKWMLISLSEPGEDEAAAVIVSMYSPEAGIQNIYFYPNEKNELNTEYYKAVKEYVALTFGDKIVDGFEKDRMEDMLLSVAG